MTAQPLSRRTQWWISFGLFTLLLTTWALANPPFAGPDEPEHIIRAASVARGELIGRTRAGHPDHVRFVEAPRRLTHARDAPTCYAGHAGVAAGCAPGIDRGKNDLVRIGLTNGRFPPTPYGVFGLPTLVSSSTAGVYLMRVLGAGLCSALLASALLSMRDTRRPWLAVSGLAFALTPMVFFMASLVNPSNLEIVAGIGFWASGLVLVDRAHRGVVDSRLVFRTAIAASVLVLARPLGVVWLGAAGVVILLTCSTAAIRSLLRARAVRIGAGVVAACVALELAWVTYYDAPGSKSPPGESAEGLGNFEVLKRTLGSTNTTAREMIGSFGWLDTPSPRVTLLLWALGIGVLLTLAFGLTRPRTAALVVAMAGLVVAVPAVLEFLEARRFGFGWQGRYTLPFAVGLPILSGFVLAQEPRRTLQRGRLAIVLGIVFVVAQLGAFTQNLRRYAVGIDGPLAFWRDSDWSPPIPSLFLLGAYTVLVVALALWVWGGLTQIVEGDPGASVRAPV